MSLYLKELNEIDGFLTLRQSIGQEEWQAALAALNQLPDGNRLGELLKLVEQMGAGHLNAVRTSSVGDPAMVPAWPEVRRLPAVSCAVPGRIPGRRPCLFSAEASLASISSPNRQRTDTAVPSFGARPLARELTCVARAPYGK